MSLAAVRWTTLVTILGVTTFCLSNSGCSYFQSTSTDEDIDLSEVEEPVKEDEIEARPEEKPLVSSVKKKTAEAGLRIGDRFPYSKTVEHRLSQTDKGGAHVSASRAEMTMSLAVENVMGDGRKQISARYLRIRYEQDIRGNRVVYSSDQPAEHVPPEALLYSGLVNNGFSFWVGPNNKVINVVDFNDFLQRCLRNIPPQHQRAIQRQLESTKGEGYVASFIDDSIGLIPYEANLSQHDIALETGAVWELEPQICESPIPMVTNTRCVLKERSMDSAEVLLTGRISGSPNPFTVQNPEGDFKVLVKGGHSSGICRFDRRTGLPTDSRIQRSIELVMELPDGQKIQQTKDTMSTFSAIVDYPQKPSSSL
jgi:Family of unknown function (DUF6263)